MSIPTGSSLGKSISYVVALTGTILMIPLVAMQFTREVDWTGSDFVAAGIVLMVTGLAFMFASRKLKTATQRATACGVIALAFLWLWAELAVGGFTDMGS
ncbi:hypothetical protein [Massilia sp. H6]|uniref:hypothetical protein n=1 Tax=Massilia sp. H6 TaxID=2970464 RepID=UPI002166D6FB|nr:hypothetical protein [Massilia sp. H6]UVW28140.1 hypothetical protein NRS07_16625 [Massilia sp. H6]